ncbi:MAG: SRPBCC family protein [Desulfobacterales bacterium]|nr:SRPBCC family protein [Desulfobacterales bacterium]
MVLAGRISVQAPIQQLWDMLLEPETMQACLPDIEKIERLNAKQYIIVIMQKVGPLTVRFKVKATLTRVEAPTHLEIEGQRADMGRANQVVFKARIDLRETAGNAAEISYTVDANIAGTLAMFGERMMQAKAKKAEAEIAKALQERLNSRA